MSSKSSLNHDGLITLEQSFIKVPLEQMKKATRTCQKYVEKEMGTLVTNISELDKTDPEKTTKQLTSAISRLKTLKRKVWRFPFTSIHVDIATHHHLNMCIQQTAQRNQSG